MLVPHFNLPLPQLLQRCPPLPNLTPHLLCVQLSLYQLRLQLLLPAPHLPQAGLQVAPRLLLRLLLTGKGLLFLTQAGCACARLLLPEGREIQDREGREGKAGGK